MYSEGLTHCSEFKDNVLGHIAGFCQRSVLRREKCLDCVEFLNKGQQVSTPLLEIKGGCQESKVVKWDSSLTYFLSIKRFSFESNGTIKDRKVVMITFSPFNIP